MQLPRALLHQINDDASIGSGVSHQRRETGVVAVFQFGTAFAFFASPSLVYCKWLKLIFCFRRDASRTQIIVWLNTINKLIPGTLEMLILLTLREGEMHGHEIAQHIQEVTDNTLQIEEGSLYPALQRLLSKGSVTARWGISGQRRRARYYKLASPGKRQLHSETENFNRLIQAISRFMQR